MAKETYSIAKETYYMAKGTYYMAKGTYDKANRDSLADYLRSGGITGMAVSENKYRKKCKCKYI